MASTANNASRIELEGDLTIERVSALRQSIVEAQPVQISLNGVERVDLAGVQLLVSVHKSLADPQRAPLFCDVPDAVATQVQQLGLDVDLFAAGGQA